VESENDAAHHFFMTIALRLLRRFERQPSGEAFFDGAEIRRRVG